MSEENNGDAGTAMTSHRPYLLRALNDWIADNGMTPHLLVDATRPGVQVPAQAVSDGKVVLNIAERAVARLLIDNDTVSFTARFGGVSHPVIVPISAVLAIYARETGQGGFGSSLRVGGVAQREQRFETDRDARLHPAFETLLDTVA